MGGLLALSPCLAAVHSDPGLTKTEVVDLPSRVREDWNEWFNTSARLHAQDRAVLAAELKREGRAKPLVPKSGDPFRPPRKPPAWFAGEDARRMAAAVISFQTPSGGWVKNTSMTKRPRRPGERWAPWNDWRYTATIDNGATTGQILFLAKVHAATGDAACQESVRRGLDYLMAAQMPSGGWPQVFPLMGGYHDNITFNDDAMVQVLGLLRDIVKRRGPWSQADAELVGRARRAVDRGVRCILDSQIRIDGKRTAWCAQHDPVTLAPKAARIYEKASLSGGESVGIVRFLMSLDHPDQEVITAVNAAVEWFRSARVNPREFGDKRSRSQSGWARFYDLKTGRPLFSDTTGKESDSVKGTGKKKKTYQWFTVAPARVIDAEYPNWRKKVRP